MTTPISGTPQRLAQIVAILLIMPLGRVVIAQDCSALAKLHLEDTNLLSATVVPAADDLPEYCRVLGYVRPAVNFEIRLPTANWNGKFYMAGCAAFCGTLRMAPNFIHGINRGLQRHYAASTMDTGHWGATGFDGRWAYHNRQAEIDFGHRAVHETARVTKLLIEAFYGRPPERSYFGGCSGGGRQAVMEALRYPEDFDGIMSGCPWLDTDNNALFGIQAIRANTRPDGQNRIGPAEIRLVEKAVYEACDSLDGLEDGLISNPRACRFDPQTLACRGNETIDCLSAEQIDVVRTLYEGPRDSTGRELYPGVSPGSEPFWGPWFAGETANVGDEIYSVASTQFLRYMAFREDPGEDYMLEDFDLARDRKRLAFMAKIYDADRPGLEAFRKSEGKLLLWHGWADPAIPPMRSVDYYEAVEQRVGSRAATQDFFRLFLVPGMDHCGSQPGPGITDTGFDPLTALERWVEEGEPPERLKTTKTDSAGSVLWTRPVCPYPERAIYDGEGDVNDASSFECADL